MSTKLCPQLVCLLAGFAANAILAAEPVIIASSHDGPSCQQPQAAVAADGTVHLVYGAGEAVFHCRSTDGGASFEKPREAFRVSNLSLGMRRGPRVAVIQDAVVVTAIGGRQGKGRDGDVQAWRSDDGGATWSGPVLVNDAADSAREGLHGMASGPEGSIFCVWLDLREKRSEVFASKSTDGGQTWQANVRVYRSPDGNVCECCHPSVAVSDGAVQVMFRNSLGGNRDMYQAASQDGGKTFSPAKKLGQGAWKLNACPMDGGMLAIGPGGKRTTVWRRDHEIFTVAGDGGKEQSLGRGQQPWVAAVKTGPVLVWTTDREGDLLARMPGKTQIQMIAGGARDPMVAAAPGGAGPVVACWESKRDGQSVIYAIRLDTGKPSSR